MIWIDKLADFLKGNKSYGIDIIWNSDEDYMLNVIELRSKGNEVNIVNNYESLKSFDDLSDKISKDIPVLLNIDGKGLIIKSIQLGNKNRMLNNDEIIHQAFPNLSEKDFYIQKVVVENQSGYLTVARKEFINKILNLFINKGFIIYNVSLGPFVLGQFERLLQLYPRVYTNNGWIDLRDGKFIAFGYHNDFYNVDYKFGDDTVNNKVLLAYVIGLCFFINKEAFIDSVELNNRRKEFIYKSAIRYSLVGTVFLLFIVLLFNFMLFNQVNKKLSESLMELDQRKELVNQLKTLKKDVSIKETYFNSNRFLENSRASFYADRIVSKLEPSITLDELKLFPKERSLREKNEYKFNSELIILSGSAGEAEELGNWIGLLKKEDWIFSLNVTSLFQLETNAKTNFELEIIIKNN